MSHDKRDENQKTRRQFSPADKTKILRLHLLEKVPISDVCEKHQITPTQFYQWQKTFFENGAAAFAKSGTARASSAVEQKVAKLEAKLHQKDEVIAEIMAEHIVLKKELGGKLSVNWVAHDIRDQVVDFVRYWSDRSELPAKRLLGWVELSPRKYHHWQERYGKANEHNGWVPRDHWLESWEKEAITQFARQYPLEGYRRLAFMMLDRDVVAVSPSSVYRVMKAAGLIHNPWHKPSRRGSGFVQPLAPHEHWHIDFSYVNIGGTFYYLCSILDGASRYIVQWDIREAMKEADAEIVLQRAREQYPAARPRIISDNGPQFVAKDFKEFIRLWQTTHVLTSPHYPQSNGKLERWHRTLKEQAIRPKTPLSLEDAHKVVAEFVDHYNAVRLHSAIGYVTPKDKLEGRAEQIWQTRDAKLEDARERRRQKREQKSLPPAINPACNGA